MSRSGLESYDAVKSASCSKSSTIRVTPRWVSAIRICLRVRSPTGMDFCAITGLAPCTSKNRLGGFSRRSDLYLNSEETSTATRVVSPVDQKRTAVTLVADCARPVSYTHLTLPTSDLV